MLYTIDVELDIDQTSDMTQILKMATPQRLSTITQPEFDQFNKWMVDQGQHPLIGVETSILRTYIAWKLRK